MVEASATAQLTCWQLQWMPHRSDQLPSKEDDAIWHLAMHPGSWRARRRGSCRRPQQGDLQVPTVITGSCGVCGGSVGLPWDVTITCPSEAAVPEESEWHPYCALWNNFNFCAAAAAALVPCSPPEPAGQQVHHAPATATEHTMSYNHKADAAKCNINVLRASYHIMRGSNCTPKQSTRTKALDQFSDSGMQINVNHLPAVRGTTTSRARRQAVHPAPHVLPPLVTRRTARDGAGTPSLTLSPTLWSYRSAA